VLRAISQPSHPDLAQRYTSARLVSRQRLSRPSGSLVATLTLPCALGVWPAFWLLPFEPFAWPRDGEVDVAETWNGDGVNHSCLHWGFYTPEDRDKHRVVGTPVQGMQSGRPIRFEFAWNEKGLVWWIDGRPVMKAPLPKGTRPMSDFVVLLNIAMGGNVCQGRLPRPDTTHDLVVHDLRLLAEPEAGGGWQGFDQAYRQARQGDTIG
jgi:beta-glucanase (GH16 family)